MTSSLAGITIPDALATRNTAQGSGSPGAPRVKRSTSITADGTRYVYTSAVKGEPIVLESWRDGHWPQTPKYAGCITRAAAEQLQALENQTPLATMSLVTPERTVLVRFEGEGPAVTWRPLDDRDWYKVLPTDLVTVKISLITVS